MDHLNKELNKVIEKSQPDNDLTLFIDSLSNFVAYLQMAIANDEIETPLPKNIKKALENFKDTMESYYNILCVEARPINYLPTENEECISQEILDFIGKVENDKLVRNIYDDKEHISIPGMDIYGINVIQSIFNPLNTHLEIARTNVLYDTLLERGTEDNINKVIIVLSRLFKKYKKDYEKAVLVNKIKDDILAILEQHTV